MLVLIGGGLAALAMATAALWSRSRAAFLTSLFLAATAVVLALGTAADLRGAPVSELLRLVGPPVVLALVASFACMVWWVRHRIDQQIAAEDADDS